MSGLARFEFNGKPLEPVQALDGEILFPAAQVCEHLDLGTKRTNAARSSGRMNEMKFQIRQGDVLVETLGGEVPATAKEVPRDNGRAVLAYGEVTGHSHSLPGLAAKMFRHDETALTAYLVVDKPASLVHDEHAGIAFVPGTYRVIQQRQWTMERQVIRVAD